MTPQAVREPIFRPIKETQDWDHNNAVLAERLATYAFGYVPETVADAQDAVAALRREAGRLKQVDITGTTTYMITYEKGGLEPVDNELAEEMRGLAVLVAEDHFADAVQAVENEMRVDLRVQGLHLGLRQLAVELGPLLQATDAVSVEQP